MPITEGSEVCRAIEIHTASLKVLSPLDAAQELGHFGERREGDNVGPRADVCSQARLVALERFERQAQLVGDITSVSD